MNQSVKSDRCPLLIPNIPSFHHSSGSNAYPCRVDQRRAMRSRILNLIDVVGLLVFQGHRYGAVEGPAFGQRVVKKGVIRANAFV